MPVTLSPCPKCGSENIGASSLLAPWVFMFCRDCTHDGPVGFTSIDAVRMWNNQEPWIVPPREVVMSEERLLKAVEGFLGNCRPLEENQ